MKEMGTGDIRRKNGDKVLQIRERYQSTLPVWNTHPLSIDLQATTVPITAKLEGKYFFLPFYFSRRLLVTLDFLSPCLYFIFKA